MQNEIRKTWFFQRSPSEVWDYLTKPELIELWLMKTDFKPIEGYKFSFIFTAKPGSTYDGVVHCEVLEIKPFTKLSYSWNGSTQNKNRNYHSTVVWTLVPKDNGTELQLRHDGFTVMDDILAHTSGWDSCLKKMENHLNAVEK